MLRLGKKKAVEAILSLACVGPRYKNCSTPFCEGFVQDFKIRTKTLKNSHFVTFHEKHFY